MENSFECCLKNTLPDFADHNSFDDIARTFSDDQGTGVVRKVQTFVKVDSSREGVSLI